jgi:hypothetical protein
MLSTIKQIKKMVNYTKTEKIELYKTKVGEPYSSELVVKQLDYNQLRKLSGVDAGIIKNDYCNKLNKFSLLSLYPYLINVMENNPKPKFTDVLRLAGKKVTSFGNTRNNLKKLGVIDYNGSTMIKGINWNKFVNDKWDWFNILEGNKILFITK